MFQLTEEEWQLVAKCDQLPERIKHSSKIPFAFTQEGVSMLSGILRSPIAVQVNINIMRAFVAMRNLVLSSPTSDIKQLQHEMKLIKHYIEDVLIDQNEINEDTRMQLELINETLAELQTKHKEQNKPRNPIGFVIGNQG